MTEPTELDIRCFRCGKTPDELGEYSPEMTESGLTPTQYVLREEGTYNLVTGHFACDSCYIAIGMPSGARGYRWVAP